MCGRLGRTVMFSQIDEEEEESTTYNTGEPKHACGSTETGPCECDVCMAKDCPLCYLQ